MELDEIKQVIQLSIPDAEVYVLDPMNDGQHLQAIVISSTFEGMSLIKQHQMVMRPLKEALASAVHALGLKTFTPEKWKESKAQFLS
ncbi:MAG: BolA/IbaG family iron-sulfur metabolism protein [Candidatus Omnitrophica bacterium]|nr:BolA/IbaG family iron-sulfur metabolism protein [Candidatus Omnitrophota bacterium]